MIGSFSTSVLLVLSQGNYCARNYSARLVLEYKVVLGTSVPSTQNAGLAILLQVLDKMRAMLARICNAGM